MAELNLTGMRRLAALAAFLLVTAPAQGADPTLDITFGADYSNGDYGETSDTEIYYLPVSIKYRSGDWAAKLAVSYLSIRGPGTVVGDGVVVGGTASGNNDARRTESGMGDTWLSLSRAVDPAPDAGHFLDLTGRIKLPTADEDKGLGTGEIDYALQLDYMYAMTDVTPFATLGYKFMGDPDDVEYDDVAYLSLGADLRLDDDTNVGLIYDFRQAATAGSDDASEMTGYLTQSLDAHWAGTFYGVAGFSDGSPDYALGLQARYRF